jgi:putative transposase
MTKRTGKPELIDVKELLERDTDFLQAALQALLQAALEAEMSETIGAEKGERTETRLAYRFAGAFPPLSRRGGASNP